MPNSKNNRTGKNVPPESTTSQRKSVQPTSKGLSKVSRPLRQGGHKNISGGPRKVTTNGYKTIRPKNGGGRPKIKGSRPKIRLGIRQRALMSTGRLTGTWDKIKKFTKNAGLASVGADILSNFVHPAAGPVFKGFVKASGLGNYKLSGDIGVGTSVIGMDEPIPKFRPGNDGNVIVSKEEYVCDITSSTDFALSSWAINPGNAALFQWLGPIAAQFEQYRLLGTIMTYKSTSADALNSTDTALGTVILATDYNVLNPNFASKSEMENYEFATSCKPSESCMYGVECAPDQTPNDIMYILSDPSVPVGSDARFYDWGNFQLATVGMQEAGVTIGELHISYVVELIKPKLGLDGGSGNLTDSFYSYTYATPANSNGYTPPGATISTRTSQVAHVPTGMSASGSFTGGPSALQAGPNGNLNFYVDSGNNNFYLLFPDNSLGKTYQITYIATTQSSGTAAFGTTASYVNCAVAQGASGAQSGIQQGFAAMTAFSSGKCSSGNPAILVNQLTVTGLGATMQILCAGLYTAAQLSAFYIYIQQIPQKFFQTETFTRKNPMVDLMIRLRRMECALAGENLDFKDLPVVPRNVFSHFKREILERTGKDPFYYKKDGTPFPITIDPTQPYDSDDSSSEEDKEDEQYQLDMRALRKRMARLRNVAAGKNSKNIAQKVDEMESKLLGLKVKTEEPDTPPDELASSIHLSKEDVQRILNSQRAETRFSMPDAR